MPQSGRPAPASFTKRVLQAHCRVADPQSGLVRMPISAPLERGLQLTQAGRRAARPREAVPIEEQFASPCQPAPPALAARTRAPSRSRARRTALPYGLPFVKTMSP
jgi:hypothetical protein